MDTLPSCDARFQAISQPFRHLLLKHHLLRMNSVALSMFTTYFLSGTWLVDLYESCYDPDLDYNENHPKKSSSSTGTSLFPGVFGITNGNSAIIFPEDDDDLEENLKATCKGDILTKHLLKEFSLSTSVQSALSLNHLFRKPSSVVIPWGKLIFRDLVGGNTKTASLLAVAVALQCFTASSYFDRMVQEEWSINENSFAMPKYSLIELPTNPFFKYDIMNLKLIVLLNAMHTHVCNDLVYILPAQSISDSAHSNMSILSSSALLHREELMQYFAQDEWVYEIETLVHALPVAITLCTADLTRIPCLWQYEYVNECFAQQFARNTLLLQTGSEKSNHSGSIYHNDTNNNDTNNNNTTSKNKVKTNVHHTTMSDASVVGDDDTMHMVSLLHRAMKTQPTLQTDIMHKLSSGGGEVKFGLLNTFPNTNNAANNNNNNAIIYENDSKKEFVHMVCLAPVVSLVHEKDDNDDETDLHHYHHHHKGSSSMQQETTTSTFSLGCLMKWFSSSSSSLSHSNHNHHHSHHHRKHDDDHSHSTFGKKVASESEAKIIALHVDMSRNGAQVADLAYICMLSFVISKLFE